MNVTAAHSSTTSSSIASMSAESVSLRGNRQPHSQSRRVWGLAVPPRLQTLPVRTEPKPGPVNSVDMFHHHVVVSSMSRNSVHELHSQCASHWHSVTLRP